MSLTTQLRQLGRINLGSLPGITLQLLRIQLPLRKETNLSMLGMYNLISSKFSANIPSEQGSPRHDEL